MRTAEEILHKHAIGKDVFIGERSTRLFRYDDALLAINEARKEAIEECSKKAIFTRVKVNKEAILSLIKDLK